MADGSIRGRLAWLERLATDERARGLPLSCAVLLATRYINAKTGKAWPSVARLAREVKATRFNTVRALDRLVEAGYLRRERTVGRGHTNRYSLRKGLADESISRKEKGSQASGLKGSRTSLIKGVNRLASEPRTLERINPGMERREGPPRRKLVSDVGGREDLNPEKRSSAATSSKRTPTKEMAAQSRKLLSPKSGRWVQSRWRSPLKLQGGIRNGSQGSSRNSETTQSRTTSNAKTGRERGKTGA
jgi:hypothetical protein